MPRLTNRPHIWLYRRSGGRLLGRMGGQTVLLLTTTGRRSGLPRTTPLQSLDVGDALVVVASNRGAPAPPAWYRNLVAEPRATVELGRETLEVRAREVRGAERERLWQRLVAANRWLPRVQRRASRLLPVIALEPRTHDGGAP